MYFIGLDAGSVTVKLVVLDGEGRKLEGHYRRHYGHPLRLSLSLLKDVQERYPQSSLSVTGSSGKMISSALGVKPVNEIVSQSYSLRKLFPSIRTVIELGGEDSKLILLEEGRIRDFSMNSVCAAGTGSFLEQQAERLRLTIEEFGDIASQSQRPSKVAGRCSVFAKSDMIHLQQIATPLEDIVAGLCFAVARNFKGTIAKGLDLRQPVAFQGGVAANKGMVRAFKEIFELDELFVPPDFALMGALGAVLKDRDEKRVNFFDVKRLEQCVSSLAYAEEGYEPLVPEADDFFERHLLRNSESGNQESDVQKVRSGEVGKTEAYLGIDIGSISTNLAVIDEEGNLLAKRYLMTAGRPIDAVRQGLEEICEEIGESVTIIGVGTTGSGRYMIADYVGADIVKNEITAQATAAISIDPTVDTIFEIGGQDSKYISLRDGIIVDFEMNKACAAGTGSFLEEQAEKLDISVKGEFAEAAFRSKNPCRLGERCTVFMENSLMANLQRGADKDSLLGGLAYSIVQNYINRVVAGKPIGKNIFFQGGVAFNKAVVAAFERYLSMRITVPPNHDVTGAIGMALIARAHTREKTADSRQSSFKGFEMLRRPYEISSFECKGCSNVCEINRVKVQDETDHLFYGGRCEKYDLRRSQKASLPDLFAFREEALWREHLTCDDMSRAVNTPSPPLSKGRKGGLGKIGIPYLFFFHDFLPFWSTLLRELGFEVIVSPKTNKQIITLGVENVLSEACFPVKVAHGHIKHLMDAGVDAILVPSFIDVNQSGDEYERGVTCPHTQTIPYVSRAAIGEMKTISPLIDLTRGQDYLIKELQRVFSPYGIRRAAIERALAPAQAAQNDFRKTIEDKGKEILSSLIENQESLAVAIIGRGYNAFDSGVNLGIPRKLSTINVLSMPMDFLPLSDERLRDSWPNMYWRSGQRILKAARFIRNIPNLYAIYLGNFSCGPDSFILKYFREEMEGKPFLHIEIDEHSADAGAITRCEAFLDSVEQQRKGSEATCSRAERRRESGDGTVAARGRVSSSLKKRTVFLTRMTDHTFAIKGAFERSGVPAEVLPESDRESVEIGKRHVSGKECYPYLVTTGDMLKRVFSSDFRPEESAFFMPSGSGPCRFGQYNVSHKLVLKNLGFDDIPIFAPNQDLNFYRELGIVGNDFSMTAWRGVLAYDFLTKCLHETRPYEVTAGETETLYEHYHDRIYQSVRGTDGQMDVLLRQMREDFMSLRRDRQKRPRVGVIGEIFVRSHRFSNENLIKKIESLGGEVWLAPMDEWIYYINAMSLRKALIKRDVSAMMNIFLKRFFQKRVGHAYEKLFKGFLKTIREPDTREILEKAAPYVHDSFEGETILSIGKAVDLVERGAAGIVNAMPFGCMPGTIVTALLKALSDDYGVPCLSIPYDGTESTTTELQLEAFMEAITTERE